MKIGAIEILPLFDGHGRVPAATAFLRPGVPDAWACHADKLDEHGKLGLPLGGFCVRTGDRVLLVDTGVGKVTLGDDEVGTFGGGDFLDSLQAVGLEPDDVTDVLFTHLHFDHVGWATQRGEVVFPNATYRAHAADWAHFVESPDAEPDAVRKLTPLLSRLETFSADGALAPGVSARHSPGHTPGSTVYVVADAQERALLLGDTAHSVVELQERDWEALWDVDPVAASATRNAIADEVADTSDLVVGAHFPGMRFGRVVTTSGDRVFRAV